MNNRPFDLSDIFFLFWYQKIKGFKDTTPLEKVLQYLMGVSTRFYFRLTFIKENNFILVLIEFNDW